MIDHSVNGILPGEKNLDRDAGQSFTLKPGSLVLVLWHSRWIVLMTTVAALVVAFIYLMKATPIYTSESRIYVEQSGPRIFRETTEGVMTQSKNYLYTQAELLKSTPVLVMALDNIDVRKMRTFAKVDNHVSYLKKALRATVGKIDDIISLSFNSPYPSEAAHLVNEIVDSYITYQATQKKSTSSEVLKILQAQKAKCSEDLTKQLKARVDFENAHPALVLEGRQGNILIAQLERSTALLTEAQMAVVESESVYEITKAMMSDHSKLKQFIEAQQARGTYVYRDGERTELRSRLDRLESSLADRLREVTADHPAVIAIESEIASLKAQIDDLDSEFAQAQIAVAEQQYLAAKGKADQIANYCQDQRKQVEDLSRQLTQYSLLQSEYDQTKKFSDVLDEQIKNMGVVEDVGALNISILEYARAADKPSEPQKARVMAIGLVVGLMLGGGLALLRDLLDQKMHSAEEISAVLEMPVLGVVPSMSTRESPSARGQKTHLDSKSRWAEAYRTVRTAVFFGAPKAEAKTILVTSPTPADGKTTLASNLAIAMAQAGQKTLIIDADFRKPMQHKIFGFDNESRGLSSVLAGTATLKEAVYRTEVENLELLVCGPNVPNPAEILNSRGFAKLLELLSNRYERIVVDSPPLVPVTDAQILGAICDITLLVLRAQKSTRKTSQQARQGLLSVGAHVLGVVVNDASKNGHSGYYGYYGYYGHGQDKNRKGHNRKPATATKT